MEDGKWKMEDGEWRMGGDEGREQSDINGLWSFETAKSQRKDTQRAQRFMDIARVSAQLTRALDL